MFFPGQLDYIFYLELLANGILGAGAAQTANFNAVSGTIYPVTVDAITATLPAAPAVGTRITFMKAASGVRTLKINPNGLQLQGSATTQTFTLDTDIALIYVDAGNAWRAVLGAQESSGAARKNLVINGAMDVAQRGTSYVNTTTPSYGAIDRWATWQSTAAASTVSQAAPAPALPGFKSALKILLTGANTNPVFATSVFETVDVVKWQGKVVTLYVRAVKGSSWNPANLALQIITGTGTDQGLASMVAATWTGQATTVNTNVAPAVTWDIYRVTFTVPATATELAVQFTATPTGAAVDANSYLMLTGVEIKEGAQSDLFDFIPYADELATCRRYYERWDVINNLVVIVGYCLSATSALYALPMKVQKRINAATFSSSTPVNAWLAQVVAGNQAATVVTGSLISKESVLITVTTGGGLTAGQATLFVNTTAGHWLAIDAEL